ncbi:MAG TPA: hypothetical protein PKB02_11060 [Anaerohalosphaeraceae bacterium]|nr:hypothetical protein [Anaerohalosphaeraceae bacterium]
MRRMLALLVSSVLVTAVSCKKQPSAEEVTNPVVDDRSQTTQTSIQDNRAVKPSEQITTLSGSENLVAIPLILPRPQFTGTPEVLIGMDNLDLKPEGWIQPPFMAPKGVVNVALNKPVTSSEPDPFSGQLKMITDGDKEATEGSYVELGPFSQWAQIDLGESHAIYAVVIWHYHKQARIYFDVAVQVADDPEFITGVTTLFNNDIDNSSGLGVGQDKNYVDDRNGLLVNAKGIKGRYVRCWSAGNNANDLNHYIEIEVYGATQ